uniref:Uroporphyrinogen decarboxylase (URO-D) domain-containing protein n=1 Tax=Desulfobacca acetoxidans TaxID=60893 RepID=A0A7C5AM75_9BACT
MIPGALHTTAMGILPHEELEPALSLALSVDIPFWPQLPHLSYYEDMYVQAAEHFPGIILLPEQNSLRFDTSKFYEELPELLEHWPELNYFDLSPGYSAAYHRFLELDLSGYIAIRGQMEGPVSFGLKVLDEGDRPIIFNDEVRPLLLDFLARRVQAQLTRLKAKHPRAFMFVDEPGLQFVFSSMSGYTDISAKEDLDRFFAQIERPRGIHLCGNPEWEFLLNRDIDILSMDTFTNGEILKAYAKHFKRFIERGGVIGWGMVPTWVEAVSESSLEELAAYLEGLWEVLVQAGVDRDQLLAQSLLTPARCCLVNPDRWQTVTLAFAWLKEMSQRLREKYQLV